MFSIDHDVQEGEKQDGLVWVINSTKSRISSSVKGCKAASDEESTEHFISTMKEKDVKIDRFEVRGKAWTRRRLVLTGSDGAFHVLQWKQHKTRKMNVGSATTSGESERLSRGLEEENSAGVKELRALIQGVEARISAQLKDFETTISTRFSPFESRIQSMDIRLQAIEQERAESTGTNVW
ncbi:hypothetical protein CFC21_078466 [Triticum aestivum]|uniref:Uncharacterized protein n=2 Tax=Triticum aestivum TaxID=4565 RepID=A0A3B6MUL6_WHEAT|nr:uncharacterized protein LOC123125128 [Triticum aestivum]XP_045084971.1 uncharacterized protein LOC123494172 [Aegilops tauschii subsp. strangulata]KAF7073492.1 hypothetical protein CFC21_078466 [Triticum aestivum]